MVAWEELRNTYKDKKVFVTGHTGFKGSWLLVILDLLSAKVKGFSLAPENEPSLYSIINGSGLCDSVIADVKKVSKLSYWHFMKHKFDHAGFVETSIMLAISDKVKMKKAKKGLITNDMNKEKIQRINKND